MPSIIQRSLNSLERVGNRLPDPAVLFVFALGLVMLLSAWMSGWNFSEVDPRTVAGGASGKPLVVGNLLEGRRLVEFLTQMVKIFTDFPPLGVVLVAMLGVGVAERSGLIPAMLRALLAVTPVRLLTPMVLLLAIVSHTAGDAGYVVLIPLGGMLFAAAGRHPLAGIAAAFAGVSGGFSANFIPSSLDPLLQGFTQSAAQVVQPGILVNPLCNLGFMSVSCLIIVGAGWWITDRVVEPRLRAHSPMDASWTGGGGHEPLSVGERRGLWAAGLGFLLCAGILWASCHDAGSPLRSATDGSLTSADAPLMKALVPLIFFFFLVPGMAYGAVARTMLPGRATIQAMSQSMGGMGHYLVMAFFAALFAWAFKESNMGTLLAVKGGNWLRGMAMPDALTLTGVVLLTATVNLLIGSASAKWALLAPVLVPMLMQAGIAPEMTQAAFRIGDSSTNIVTPLLPYAPLILVYCQKHVRDTGLGTLISMMLPYSVTFLVMWTLLLMAFLGLGLPLGLGMRG